MKLLQALTTWLPRPGRRPGARYDDAAPQAAPRPGPNAHVEIYLDYYRRLKAPGFAVLLTGDWGVGKTRLAKRLLHCGGDAPHTIYVSLFGVKSREEIEAAVYAEMFPAFSTLHKLTERAVEAGKGVTATNVAVAGATGGVNVGALLGSFTPLIAALLRKEIDSSKTLLFDDLERSTLSAKELLGLVNHYVEHYGCRVVALAHDEKFIEEVQEAKEKVFGQTLQVAPDIDAAYEAFVDEIENIDAQDFIDAHEALIKSVFRDSGVNSLRALRQVLFDLARLYDALETRHRANAAAMRELVGLFTALDFETRAGRLGRDDLRQRYLASAPDPSSDDPKHARINSAFARYTTADLRSDASSDDLLAQMLFDGRYEPAPIVKALDASAAFRSLREQPAWLRLANFDALDDDEVAEAIEEIQFRLDRQEITDAGELLHVFALRLMLAQHGAVETSVEAVEAQCRAYVDRLFDAGRLPPMDRETYRDAFRHGAAHGHLFWIEPEFQDHFARLRTYLSDKSEAAMDQKLRNDAAALLRLMDQDVRKFVNAVSPEGGGDHAFARLPALKHVPPKAFVDAFMAARREDRGWLRIRSALERRYDAPALAPADRPGVGWLASERNWIRSVIAEMRARAAAAQGLARYRIERAIPNVVIPEDEAPPPEA